MMHKKNFVAAIKVGGKILRESSDRVELPFGSEYSILLKNLDTVRMQAQIGIDGQDASGWLVIQPGESVEVERFYRGNQSQGNRFKFIERTERIEEHRGIKAEDGLVRVEFKREKVYELPKIVEHHTYHYHTWPYVHPRPYIWYPGCFGGTFNSINQPLASQGSLISNTSNFSRSLSASSGVRGSSSGSHAPIQANMMKCSNDAPAGAACATETSFNDAGITVDGSISNQRFTSVAGFECETSEAIVLHLVGCHEKAQVKVAKTVDQKPTCETCGKKNKATSKFCVECGTSLEKV